VGRPESEYLFEKEVDKVDDRLDPAVLPWSFEGAEGVGVLLESCNGDVARIRKSLERPGCDFGIRLDEGLMAEVTGMHRALFAGRLLTVAALYELRQGHLETAVDDVELSEMSHKPQPAWLAEEIRLVNVVDGLYWQGHDRALAESW